MAIDPPAGDRVEMLDQWPGDNAVVGEVGIESARVAVS
jgi:hypothetical protein